MTKKELNLLQFAAGGAAEPSATPTEIVRCESGDADLGREFLDDVPHGLLRYAFPPNSTRATHTPEKPPRFNSGRLCPFVQQAEHPLRDRNGSDVTGLSAQVDDRPMTFALLQMAEIQLRQLMAAESARQQNGKQRPITFALESVPGLVPARVPAPVRRSTSCRV